MDKDKNLPQTDDIQKPQANAEDTFSTPDPAMTNDEDKDAEEEADKKALRALRNLTSEDDNPEGDDEHFKLTLSSILGGDIVMLVAMTIVYVSNRYSCQQEMIQSKLLNDTLLDCRYKALTRSSELKERTRRSYIEKSLTDTTLQTSNTPSFDLPVDYEE